MEDQPEPREPTPAERAFALAVEAGNRCRRAMAKVAAMAGSISAMQVQQDGRITLLEFAALRELVFDVLATGPDGEIDDEKRAEIVASYFQRAAQIIDAETERMSAPLIIAGPAINGTQRGGGR